MSDGVSAPRRVLVTGGAGFIGANLCRVLAARGHRVDVLDDLSTGYAANLDGVGVSVHRGSVCDAALVGHLVDDRLDAVVHLAALGSVPRSVVDPLATHRANVDGTLAVLEAARRNGTQVVVAGSSSVYGSNPVLPKHEDLATRPLSPYAASKLAAEGYVLGYAASYDLPVLAFRFFNVFGPLQRAGHAYAAVIPAFVDAALRGASLTVHGDGTQSRDFTYVGTLCAVLADAVERRIVAPQPVNLAFGSRITLLDVITAIEGLVGHPVAVRHEPPRAGDVAHSTADNAALRALFPDVRPTAFADGLAATVAWMRAEIAAV